MKDEKIVCTYCKSDKFEYVPAPFQGQDPWFDVRYEQQENGKFKAAIRGDNGKKDNADVSTINTSVMLYNDSRPWFNCLSCTAELDGFRDVDYKPLNNSIQLEFNFT